MRILAIGAHFDDVELGCGGTMLRHKERGDEIFIMVITHSAYSSPSLDFNRTKEQAREEGDKSAKALGAKLICCDKESLTLVPNEKSVLEIEYLVNQIKPDRVYTHQSNDSHADHAAVGYMTMRACRKCNEVFLYRSNWFIMDNTQDDQFYVDISDYIELKLNLLRLFKTEMEKINYSWLDFVKKQNNAAGAKVNVSYAETFHVMKMLWK